MKFFSTVLILLSFVACTKNGGSGSSGKATQKISFDSPFHFVYDSSLAKTDVIAAFGDEKVEKNQVNRNLSAIQGLVAKKQEETLALAYRMANQAMKDVQSDKKIIIQVPFAEPQQGLKAILGTFQSLVEGTNIQTQFSTEGVAQGSVVVDGKTYTEDQLALKSLPFSKIQSRIFNLRLKGIEDHVGRRVLLAEAKKNNVSLAQYIKDNVAASKKVTDEDAKQYGIENNIPEKEINEKMLQSLKSILETKDSAGNLLTLSAKLLGKKTIRVAYKKPLLVLDAIDFPESTPQKGSGKVRVTLLSSLMCAECKEVEKQLSSLVDNSLKKLKLSYVFHFKPEDRVARMVSEASLCVAKQDQNKFWDFQEATHSEVFDGNEKMINETVESLGLNFSDFRKCFLSREFQKTIDDQKIATESFGYLKLPVVLVNGIVFENPQSMDEVKSTIQAQIAASGMANSKGFWAWLKSFFQ